MQSPYKKIVVYDLETGGFSSKYQSITEIAMVVIDLENLQIVDKMSYMISPLIDLSQSEKDMKKEAKAIFKAVAMPDPETNIKTLTFNGSKVTLKTLDEMVEYLEEFWAEVVPKYGILLDWKAQKEIIDEEFDDVMNLYFDYKYNPQALEATKIPKELIIEEGIDYREVHKHVVEFLEKQTVGNSKPIIAGHNIKDFDNPFMDVFFKQCQDDFDKHINKKIIDTLEEARMKWYELPNYTLSTCANEVGLTLKNAHRALPDTIANAEFLVEVLKNLRGEGKGETKYVRRKYKFNF